MKINTIIVTHNGEKWIGRCLKSLKQSSVAAEVIVIDNGSTDLTKEIIKSNFEDVELVELERNIGFGQANNIGLVNAVEKQAQYVFLLNQDTWVKPDTLETLLNVAMNHAEYGILSPFHLDASGARLERQFADFVSTQYNGMLVSDLFFNKLKDVYETSYIHAASWFMSRRCVQIVGGFDPIYFHYGEDDDYIQRVKHFGFKVGLVPSAELIHDATYKTWEQVEWDVNRNLVYELQQLKRMFPHFRTNLLLYIKSSFDELTTFLLTRKFRKFLFRFKIKWRTIRNLGSVRSSYKSSFKERAFLQ